MDAKKDIFEGGQVGFKFLRIDLLADNLGTSEAPLRFMLGIIIGYPLALLFLLIPRKNATARHLYFGACGIFISYFCFGTDCIYNFIPMVVSYASLVILGSTKANVIFSFIFQSAYLFGAYIFHASDGYDVKWTTPQCILCLRLIGLAWDCYDGQQDPEKLRGDLKTTCYSKTPKFIEVLGYSYYFGGFMAGPQFSFQRYIKFIEDRLVDPEGLKAPNSRFFTAFKRSVGGIVCLLVFVKFDPMVKADLLLTQAFKEQSFLSRCTQMMLMYHIHFCKYVSIWMFSESICTITGLSYNGVKDGRSKWDGVRNFKFRRVMFGPFFQDMLEGFNINTSQWAGRYLFKRLMFLGNKNLSHVITLLYLSLWHGFYVGYLILFAIEFLLLIGERQLCAALRVIFDVTYDQLSLPLRLTIRVTSAIFRMYACAFAATAFVLLRWRRIRVEKGNDVDVKNKVYAEVYYWLLFVIVLLYAAIYVAGQIARSKKRKSEDTKKDN